MSRAFPRNWPWSPSAAGRTLEEPLVIRPTSETIIGHMYSKWIKSYRDLPVLINQWGSVVRWELRTTPVPAHARVLLAGRPHRPRHSPPKPKKKPCACSTCTLDFAVDDAAVPVIQGRKSSTREICRSQPVLLDRSHDGRHHAPYRPAPRTNLGQNFAKAFDIRYLDMQNELQHCWTTSWGLSTRFIGAIIMTHGDDQGLVLPPRLAPIQVVIVPIFRSDTEKALVMPVVEQVRQELSSFRVKVDDRSEVTPGFKFNDWELRGVPLQIEIGPKDVDKGSVAMARRDMPGKAGKSFIPQEGLSTAVGKALEDIQTALLEKARAFRDAHIFDPKDYAELKEVVQNGWAFSWWCGSGECEAKIKEDTRATTRCIPLDQPGGTGRCIYCGAEATEKVYFAKAY